MGSARLDTRLPSLFVLFRRGLTTLNASAVSPAERWDAEINYLRLVTDELAAAAAAAGAAGGDAVAAREAVLATNPRFGELTQARQALGDAMLLGFGLPGLLANGCHCLLLRAAADHQLPAQQPASSRLHWAPGQVPPSRLPLLLPPKVVLIAPHIARLPF